MTTIYWTKLDLYQSVDHLMDCMNITIDSTAYPLNSKEIAYDFCTNLTISIVPFPTAFICGILCKDETETAIALNSNREDTMHNFDCMHELIHYFFHEGTEFKCINTELAQIKQNKYLEWQANEGAAQALVPYQLFIPQYVKLSNKHAKNTWNHLGINANLAKIFNVSPKVIENRINNLGYEIYQYMQGVPLDKIKILSKNQLDKMGIKDQCKPQKSHCTKCLSVINEEYDFCHICGINLKGKSNLSDFRTNKGVGYMKYNGVSIDQKYKSIQCPKCRNEEIHENGEFCKICGLNLINRCIGCWEEDNNDNSYWSDGCKAILDGSSRYCPFCGKESHFYRENILLSWNNNEIEEAKKQAAASLLTINEENISF